MSNKTLLLLLICSFSVFSFVETSPKTDWITMGLKGKVKKLTDYWITVGEDNREDTIFIQTHHFTKEGLLNKLEMKEGKFNPYIYEITHDAQGYAKLITNVSNTGTPLTVFTISKETSGDTIILKSKVTYNIGRHQSDYDTYFVNNLMIKEHYLNPQQQMSEVVLHEYDETGWETKTRFYNDTVMKERAYIYERTDKAGNWTRRTEAQPVSSSFTLTQVRKLVYY